MQLRAGREGGVEIPSRNVDMMASRAIPGAVRTFARALVMGSVDLLPFAERGNLSNNSHLLLG